MTIKRIVTCDFCDKEIKDDFIIVKWREHPDSNTSIGDNYPDMHFCSRNCLINNYTSKTSKGA